ncbi:unnamed protein product [Withania somnifera]
MGTEEKALFCFCHWAWKNKALPDGDTSYVGGITRQVIVKTGIKYNDFVAAILHFTVKLDRSQLIELKDQEDVNTLLQFNDSFANVYASNFEEEPNAIPPSGGTKEIEFIVNELPSPLNKAWFKSAGDGKALKTAWAHKSAGDGKPQQKEAVVDDGQKTQNCFAIDQIWACYDVDDETLRCYALNPNPEYPREQAWVRGLLPVGCGKFKCGRIGSTEYTSDLHLFSHQLKYLKGKRGLDEIWATFKDWDINWSFSPSNHREYKYEVVEILSNYEYGVADLFSHFQTTRPTVVDTFFIKPKDYYRFSHQVPSFKMTGTEGVGAPAGSFELDFHALPHNPDDIWYPGKVEENSGTADSEPLENVLSVILPGTRDESRTPDNAMTSLESGNLKGIHTTDNGKSSLHVDLDLKLWFDGTQK